MVIFSGCHSLTSGAKRDDFDPINASKKGVNAGNSARQTDPAKCILEVRLISIDASRWNQRAATELWRSVDETVIDAEVRSTWNRNGFRVGQIQSQEEVQTDFEMLTEHQNILDDFFADAGVDATQLSNRKPIIMDNGRRYEHPVGPPRPGSDVYLFRKNIGPPEARTLSGGQCLFAFRADGDLDSGTVRLRIAPEIQYGRVKQHVTPSDTGMRIDHRRQSWPLSGMAINWTAGLGQSLLITPEAPTTETSIPLEESVQLVDRMLGRVDAQRRSSWWAMLIKVRQVPQQ
ncbi:MAG: hypothetical protein AAF664_05740 [Planctomycetota bacterium]